MHDCGRRGSGMRCEIRPLRPHLSRRAFLTGGVAVAVGLGLAGCADGETDYATTPASGSRETTPGLDLPTNDEDALRALFDPFLEPLGQHVTRAGLYDIESGFVRDDEGDHLALYVEPIDPDGEGWDEVRYIESVVPGVAATAPYIFETWADVETMDICQEPPQAEAPEEQPPIVTQVQLSRSDSAGIDWGSADLADLIGARLRSPDSARVVARDDVEAHPLWAEAEDVAPARIGER